MLDLTRICELLKIDPRETGLELVDAHELAADYFPRLDTDRAVLITTLESLQLARDVRRTLLVNYPPDHTVTLVHGEHPEPRSLQSLARAKSFSATTILYVPPLPQLGSPQTLAALVARLRAPGGCPWDREQTHLSLRKALLEETYEVIEALDENDPAKLQEELGDLLLHVLFQTQIARDLDEFRLSDVGIELAAKLIRRHPHVFGDVQVRSAEEVVQNWERIKQEEKKTKAGGKAPPAPGLDAGIPRELPALPRAQKIFKRARREGIAPDGKGPAGACATGLARARDREKVLGDLLLDLAGLAEQYDLDAESALRASTARLVKEAKKKKR